MKADFYPTAKGQGVIINIVVCKKVHLFPSELIDGFQLQKEIEYCQSCIVLSCGMSK